ncbi:MAG: hypothetical protein ACI4TH_09160 [Candidatus Ornithomonoglobus sp.]
MPIVDGKYVAPKWTNKEAPPISAGELQAMCDTLAAALVEADGTVNITGNLRLAKGSLLEFSDSTGNGGASIYDESTSKADPVLSFYGINGDEPVTLRNVQSPAEDHDAANKLYVDNATSGVAKIVTGTYTGTGTYGSDNPCTLTFDFTPKAVFLGLNSDNTVGLFVSPYIWGADNFVVTASKTAYVNTVSLDENTMSWYSGQTVGSQLNAANTVYSYVAIG